MNEELEQLLLKAPETLVLIAFSAPHDPLQAIQRVRIRPVQLKKGLHFQIEEFSKTQCFTKNSPTLVLDAYKEQFSQAVFRFQDKEFHLLMGKVKVRGIKATANVAHDRKKSHLIALDEPVDFLIHLGIQNKAGKVLREKHDKFKQINQFVQL